MTPEKAIKFFDEEIERLERAPIINGCEMTDDWRGHLEICKLAKSALEKQIPKKVTHESTLYKCCTCPNCKNVVDEFTFFKGQRERVIYNHCRICGQALDWSEQNDG